VPVDGGAGDPEFRGDLRHGVRAFTLVVGLVVHLLGQGDLAGAEFGFLAAGAAAGAGGESVDGALGHEGVLELGDGTEDLEEHAAEGGGGIDALVEHDQVDTAVLKLLGQLEEVFQGAAAPVEFGDDDLVGGTWHAVLVPASTASSITVVETLALLDNKFALVADAVENGTYALWLGSGISRERVADLNGVVERVLDFLQSKIDAGDPECPFRKGLDQAIKLGDLTLAERVSIDVKSPTHSWPLLALLTSRLVGKYSDLLDIRVKGQPDDFLLWDAVDVRVTYPPGASPDCEHLCIAILAIEGVVPKVASANWDGLLESAVGELAEIPEDILQVVVRAIDFRGDAARSELLKFHGCAVLAGKDEAVYRELLVARKPKSQHGCRTRTSRSCGII